MFDGNAYKKIVKAFSIVYTLGSLQGLFHVSWHEKNKEKKLNKNTHFRSTSS